MVHVSGDVPDQSLEGGPGEKHVYRLLIAFDLSERDSTRLEANLASSFHATSCRGRLLNDLVHLCWHLGGSLGFSSDLGFGHIFWGECV